jgi:hypothetical protein
MARRAPTEDKQARATAEAATHGGVAAMQGGPWNGFWFWRDDWERAIAGKLAGYVETADQVENKPIKDPHGVDLRWYGPGVVCRYDASLVPDAGPASDVPPIPRAYCACGEQLFLPGRDTCERCRLGIPPGSCLVWRPHGVVPAEPPVWFAEPTTEPSADSALADGELDALTPELGSATATLSREPTPSSDPAEVADFVWSCVAHLYDR